MPYTQVKSFEKGIDTRRLIDTTEPGALLEARDCHITLAGELEKRAAFVVLDTLPPETIGLYVTEGRVYHTWGDAATAPAGLPAGTVYHSIPDPDGSPLEFIMSVEEFAGGIYTVAKYEDQDILHWYGVPDYATGAGNDGLIVYPPIPPPDPTDPDPPDPPTSGPGGKPQCSMLFQPVVFGTPADVYVTAIYLLTPTTTFNFGPSGVIDAWMLLPTTSTSGGFPLCNTEIITAPTLGSQIANHIQGLINSSSSTPQLQAQATGDTVLFWVYHDGPAYNGWKIEVKLSGAIWSPTGPVAFTGGVAALSALIGGPFPAPRAGTPGAPIENGTFALAHSRRMWSVQRSTLNYSNIDDATEWGSLSEDAGSIDMSKETTRSPELVSLADYHGELAIFGTRHILIYHMELDWEKFTKLQTLHGTGTFAPHSVVPFGEGEVMYIDISGIRSLRTRTGVDTAFAADIGNMIDPLVKVKIASDTPEVKYHRYWGMVEPRSGRLWMALHDKIFVLSYYPTGRIAAWTWYDATEAPVDMMCSSDYTVYWRSVDNIVAYGGEDGITYDDTEALARVPYIDAGKPATSKNWQGIDVALYGDWGVRGSFDPTLPAALDLLANLTKSTYAQQKIAMNGESPGVSLEFRSTFVGPARIGNAAVHYSDSTAD